MPGADPLQQRNDTTYLEGSSPSPFRSATQPAEQVLALFGPEHLAERLRAIQSITDAALAHLELEELLGELLRRLRDALSADTVRVLLCTEDGTALRVRARIGLEEHAEQEVVIPIGQGLAGRVAAQREAVIVDDLSQVEVLDPLLRQLSSMMVAPLLVEGRLLGVLKVGSIEPRTFTESDLSLLQMVADRVALAIDRAQRFEELQREIEEHERAEESLRQSEERFRLLVSEVQNYAIFLLDPEGHVASWNLGAQRIKGYTEEEVRGRHFSLFYTPEDVQRQHPQRELAVAAREGRYEEEGWRVRKDGTRFWANVVVTALHANEKLVGFSKVTRDLTDHRQREEALRESEERFRVFAESASDAIFAIDEESTILYANPAVERIFGYAVGDLLGERMTLLIPEGLRAAHRDGVQRYLATQVRNIPWSGVQLPGLHRSGREIPLEISFGEYVKDGKRFFTGIARDVSERVVQQRVMEETAAELEATVEELQTRTEEAEAANQAKTDFLAVMSHELRTPLAAILGYAELLQLGIPVSIPEESHSHVKRIDVAARHQLQLIEEILSFSRISAGREELELDQVELRELAREAVEFVQPLADRKGLPLHLAGPELPLLAVTDRAKVRQILVNLLSNAVKFTARGEIRVAVERRPGAVVFQIQDTGVAIAPEHLKKIFDPFWQVQQSKTREAEGMGLGLTTARRLARLLDGDVQVESVPGTGSTFTLRLPLVAEDAER